MVIGEASAEDHFPRNARIRRGRMNRMGRLAILVMLLIVALLIIWQVFGAAWG
jgi:hypothetical protein